MTSPALCEVCIDTGRATALAAIGICKHCGRAACRAHCAQDQYGIPFADECQPCVSSRLNAQREKRNAEASEGAAEIARIGELVKELIRAGVQPVERFETQSRWKKKIFGKGYTPNRGSVNVRVSIQPAWPVGELDWRISEGHTHGEFVSSLPSGITRSSKIVPLDGPAHGRTLDYGWSKEILDGHRVLERSGEVRQQVIDALERQLRS